MHKERNQILGADVEDIRGLAPLIEAILSMMRYVLSEVKQPLKKNGKSLKR